MQLLDEKEARLRILMEFKLNILRMVLIVYIVILLVCV